MDSEFWDDFIQTMEGYIDDDVNFILAEIEKFKQLNDSYSNQELNDYIKQLISDICMPTFKSNIKDEFETMLLKHIGSEL